MKNKIKEEKLSPSVFIMNFRAEVPNPNPILFCLIMSNYYNGRMLKGSGVNDFYVLVYGKIYSTDGLVDDTELNQIDLIPVDRLSILENIRLYNVLKWLFINEDQHYYNDIN